MGRFARGLLRVAGMAGAAVIFWLVLPLCLPPGEIAEKDWVGKPNPAAWRSRRPPAAQQSRRPAAAAVNLSTPPEAFRSYLDSYERGDHTGMYQCMSRRLRGCCGCANAREFCAKMDAALNRRNGDGPALAYYRSLLPLIEKQFAARPAGALRFEAAFANRPRPSRLVFVSRANRPRHFQLVPLSAYATLISFP